MSISMTTSQKEAMGVDSAPRVPKNFTGSLTHKNNRIPTKKKSGIEGDFADTCVEKFLLMSMGAERRV